MRALISLIRPRVWTVVKASALIALGSILTLAVLVFRFLYFEVGSQLAPGVTREAMLSIRGGMEEDRLRQILGEPLCRRGDLWIYGEPNWLGAGFRVTLQTRAGTMARAVIQHYGMAIYWCSEANCPVIHNAAAFLRLPSVRTTE